MKKSLTHNILLVILTLILVNPLFSQSIEELFDESIEVDSLNVPTDPNQPYFPKAMFPEVKTIWTRTDTIVEAISTPIKDSYDEFVVNWYSSYLYVMKEPLLFNRKTEKDVFRFTWLRTFHNPMTFRIEKWKNRFVLYWKVLNGAGGYDPGELVVNKMKIITQNEWNDFIMLLDKSNFWEMDLGRSSIGNDGAEWIMEGRNQTDYRVVTVWSPNKGPYYDACNYLIALSGVKINDSEKY